MDVTRDYHSKWGKSEQEKQIPYEITYIWSLKYDTNEHIYETGTESRTDNRLVVAKSGGSGSWG